MENYKVKHYWFCSCRSYHSVMMLCKENKASASSPFSVSLWFFYLCLLFSTLPSSSSASLLSLFVTLTFTILQLTVLETAHYKTIHQFVSLYFSVMTDDSISTLPHPFSSVIYVSRFLILVPVMLLSSAVYYHYYLMSSHFLISH